MRLRRRDRRDESLARGTDQDRQAEGVELIEPAQRDQALLLGLAESDAGIEHDVLAGDAGAGGDVERAGEESGDLLHDVDGRVGALAVMHHDDRRMARGKETGHAALALQAPDVVGDHGALVQCPGDHFGLHAVDRDGNTKSDDVGEYRLQAAQFHVGGNGLRAAIGAGGIPRRYR